MEEQIAKLEAALDVQAEINIELLSRIGRLDNLVALVCTTLSEVMVSTGDLMIDVSALHTIVRSMQTDMLDLETDLDAVIVKVAEGRGYREDETTS